MTWQLVSRSFKLVRSVLTNTRHSCQIQALSQPQETTGPDKDTTEEEELTAEYAAEDLASGAITESEPVGTNSAIGGTRLGHL